jgi:hypothetical protein
MRGCVLVLAPSFNFTPSLEASEIIQLCSMLLTPYPEEEEEEEVVEVVDEPLSDSGVALPDTSLNLSSGSLRKFFSCLVSSLRGVSFQFWRLLR